MADGTVEIDFGSDPAVEASVLVSSGLSGLTAATHKEAFVQGDSTTTDNDADSHKQFAISAKLSCEFVSATSMRIYATLMKDLATGKFLLHWVTK